MATRRKPVVWSWKARRELEEVLEHIASVSPGAAQLVARRALNAADSLETMAERGRVVPEVRIPTIRETFLYSYRMIYHVGASRITVLSFLHGARDFDRWRRGGR